MDYLKKIKADKGSQKADTVNNPLAECLMSEEEFTDFLPLNVITLNLLLSGRIDKAIPIGGSLMVSSPSRFGKSLIMLTAIKAAQKKNMPCILIVTEGKNSFNFQLAKKFGIDTSQEKLMIFEESGIEEIRNIIAKLFDGVSKLDRNNTFLGIDSWGGLCTLKTVEDSLEGKTTMDMSESRLKNRLANLLNQTKTTRLIINHVYDAMGGFGDPLKIPGGRRIFFLSDNVLLMMSRAKEKKDDEINGYIISAKTEKSRFSKEGSQLKFRIKSKGGLDPWWGLLDLGLEAGVILKEGNKYYRQHIKDDIPIKEQDMYTEDFWVPIFKKTDFKNYLEKRFTFTSDLDINKGGIEKLFCDDLVSDETTETSAVVEESVPKKSKKKKE